MKGDTLEKRTISVIVPCYNAEKTIERCVSSLLNQTYLPLEILLFNDGSQDNTGEILNKLSKKYYSLRVFHQENKGVSATRNQGIDLANGDYISFIDADDYIFPTFFETLIADFDETAQISVVQAQKSTDIMEPIECSGTEVLNEENYFNTLLFGKNVMGYPWNKLYRKDIIKVHNIRFDESVKIMEDLAFNLEYAQFVTKAIVSHEKLYYYQIHKNSALHKGFSESFMTTITAFEIMANLSFPKDKIEDIKICSVRGLLWLVARLYRLGTKSDIKKYESRIFDGLKKEKKLFLRKGLKVGKKYYISYLLFSISPKLLRLVIR